MNEYLVYNENIIFCFLYIEGFFSLNQPISMPNARLILLAEDLRLEFFHLLHEAV